MESSGHARNINNQKRRIRTKHLRPYTFWRYRAFIEISLRRSDAWKIHWLVEPKRCISRYAIQCCLANTVIQYCKKQTPWAKLPGSLQFTQWTSREQFAEARKFYSHSVQGDHLSSCDWLKSCRRTKVSKRYHSQIPFIGVLAFHQARPLWKC